MDPGSPAAATLDLTGVMSETGGVAATGATSSGSTSPSPKAVVLAGQVGLGPGEMRSHAEFANKGSQTQDQVKFIYLLSGARPRGAWGAKPPNH